MESELFNPIKEFFEAQGFTCDGEVNDIDLYMEKEGECIAVELKQALDFKAVQQAALRQKITDTVFIGIFTPNNIFSPSFKDRLYLLKRLGIGLITVSKKTHVVKIINEPVVRELSSFQSRNRGKKKALQTEFSKRTLKSNTGGVNREKLMTSYREAALEVLDALAELEGAAAPREIKKLCGIEKTYSILRGNYYGWFESKEKGIYRLTDAGYDALEEFEEPLAVLRKSRQPSNDIAKG